MKLLFKHRALQKFGLKLNIYVEISTQLKLWVAGAMHNFKGVKN